jgi:hypothetical protein
MYWLCGTGRCILCSQNPPLDPKPVLNEFVSYSQVLYFDDTNSRRGEEFGRLIVDQISKKLFACFLTVLSDTSHLFLF